MADLFVRRWYNFNGKHILDSDLTDNCTRRTIERVGNKEVVKFAVYDIAKILKKEQSSVIFKDLDNECLFEIIGKEAITSLIYQVFELLGRGTHKVERIKWAVNEVIDNQ